MVKATITFNNKAYSVDLSSPIDISIPFESNKGVIAYGAKPYSARPFTEGDFIGSLEAGSPVNFYNLEMNPHGNGTHTESMLHIDSRGDSIQDTLRQFHFLSYLITVTPVLSDNGDLIIKTAHLDFDLINTLNVEALIVRTSPNTPDKKSKNYTSTNPPYFERAFISELNKTNVKHILVDLPSLDKEKDEGVLSGHNAFWETEATPKKEKTITELVYIDNEVEDGLFLLNLQIISLDIDVSPSKPVLYRIIENEIN